MGNYWTCPKCGAHLDPGEPCDCDQDKISDSDMICKQYKKFIIETLDGISDVVIIKKIYTAVKVLTQIPKCVIHYSCNQKEEEK